MKPYGELFKQFLQGTLPDEKIAELNRLLIDNYFHSSQFLDQDERFYAEDLLFEQLAKNDLEEPYHNLLLEKMRKNPALMRRYRLACDLMAGTSSEKIARTQALTDSESTESKEEEQLKILLEGVFEQVHAEDESSIRQENTNSVWLRLRDSIEGFAGAFMVLKPGYRWAMAVGSLALLLMIAWFITDPGGESTKNDQPIAGRTNTDNNPVIKRKNDPTGKVVPETVQKVISLPEKQREYSEDEILRMKNAAITKLVRSFFSTFESFDISLTRGETSNLMDSLLLDEENYNAGSFSNCAVSLKQ